jgi:hypothetical protein
MAAVAAAAVLEVPAEWVEIEEGKTANAPADLLIKSRKGFYYVHFAFHCLGLIFCSLILANIVV